MSLHTYTIKGAFLENTDTFYVIHFYVIHFLKRKLTSFYLGPQFKCLFLKSHVYHIYLYYIFENMTAKNMI